MDPFRRKVWKRFQAGLNGVSFLFIATNTLDICIIVFVLKIYLEYK